MKAGPFLILGHLLLLSEVFKSRSTQLSPRLSTSCGERTSVSLVLGGSCSTDGLQEIIHACWKGHGRVLEES